MAMDAIFQYGRLSVAGVSELRGNGQLINKEVLIKCGSFNEDTVTDDLDLSLRLLFSKAKIGILWDPPVMEEAVENLNLLYFHRGKGGPKEVCKDFLIMASNYFQKKLNLYKNLI